MHIIECQGVIKNEKIECMTDVAFDKLTLNKIAIEYLNFYLEICSYTQFNQK